MSDFEVKFSEVLIKLQCNKCFETKEINLFSKFDVKCSCGGTYTTMITDDCSSKCPHCSKDIKVIRTEKGFKFNKS